MSGDGFNTGVFVGFLFGAAAICLLFDLGGKAIDRAHKRRLQKIREQGL